MPDIIGPAKATEADVSVSVDAITLLEQDHAEVAELFTKFEDSDDPKEQLDLTEQICAALKVHAQIEEEIFYPAAEEALSDDDQHLLAEAEVEHDTLKGLIASIEESVEDPLFEAKVKVLSEYVKHHVEEEENELFPKLTQADLDVSDLGRRLANRKAELLAEAQDPTNVVEESARESVGRDENEWARDGVH